MTEIRPLDAPGEGDETPAFSPAADVYELEGTLLIRLALPGVLEADIDVSFGPEGLTVRGELEPPPAAGEARAIVREWRYGYFERRIALPSDVDSERVSVEVESGVLEIRLPRRGAR